jgi:hypothetical protein
LIFAPAAVSGRQAKKTLPQCGQTKRFWVPLIPPSTDILDLPSVAIGRGA